jgi:AFG3 family protein
VRALVARAYDSVMAMLTERREELDQVAELLLEKEVISHEDMTALLGERDGQDAAYDVSF